MGITHSTVVLTADDGTSEVGTDEWNAAHTITTDLSPGSNDSASLGVEGTAWSDLFMADGGVVSFGASATCTIVGSAGTFAFKTAAAERMRIDNAGRAIFGGVSAESAFFNGANTPYCQLLGTSSDSAHLAIVRFASSTANPARLTMARSRGTTIGDYTVVAAEDQVGQFLFMAADGTNLEPAASIEALIDATAAAGAMPGRIVLKTSAAGSGTPTERMRIDSAGITSFGLGNVATSLRVYNTYTDSSNYERGVFDWTTTANTLTIGTQKGGTGSARALNLLVPTNSNTLDVGALTLAHLSIPDANSICFVDNVSTRVQFYTPMPGVILGSTTYLAFSPNASVSGYDVAFYRNAAGVIEVNNGTAGTYAAAKMATLYRTGYRSVSADITMSAGDSYILMNKAATTASVTLTTATAAIAGREIYIKNLGSTAIVSGGASANIVPINGAATSQAIVAGTAGKYAKLYCDGTTWHIMEAN